MPRNINFLLDTLLVDEAYVVTGGNTEPSIIDGLMGNVTFKPWTGFGTIIKDANDVVERLSGEQLKQAKSSLEKAQGFIDMKRRSHMMSIRTEEERKALYEARTAKQPTSNIGTSDGRANDTESSASEGGVNIAAGSSDTSKSKHNPVVPEAKIGESASKKPRIEPWHVRKTVTSSLSIADLHSYVTLALQELLCIMYPAENFNLEERLLSSENVMAEASDKMIEKYMRACIKNMEQQHNETDGLQKEKHREGNNAQNKDDGGTEGKELAQPEEGHPLRRSPRIKEKRKIEKEKSSLSDAACSDESDLIPKKPVIEVNQTPDRCLFRVSLNDPGVIPVCCYEFKGPTLDLTGLISSEKIIDSSTTGTTIPQFMSHTNTTTYNRQYQPTAGSSNPSIGSIGGTVNNTSAEGQEGEDDLYIPGLSASAIAGQYDRLFRDTNEGTSNNANGKLVLLPIAQVICQALLSRTGCVFLTNHQTAFALRVEEDKATDSFGAIVFVTGAIPCDKEPGQFAAMLGFTKYCVDTLLHQETEDEMLNPMRRLLMSLSYAAYNVDKVMEPLDPDWCPGDQPSGLAEGHRSERGARCTASHFEPIQAAKADSVVTNQIDGGVFHYKHHKDGESSAGDISALNSSSSENSVSTADQEDGAGLKRVGNMQKPLRSDMDERFKTMFSATEGLMAVGASGIVIRGLWDGTRVAIKMWNGQSREGFLSIRKEIKVFRRLQMKCPSVLGSAVPRFLFGWDNPQEYSVYRKQLILLTELVGDGISSTRDGSLWIQDGNTLELLTSGDRILICKAALCSLEELHKNGFIHGDIALRNMRVRKLPAFEQRWKVWWLDLGRAVEMKDNASPMYVKHEMRRCLALFGLSELEGTFRYGSVSH